MPLGKILVMTSIPSTQLHACINIIGIFRDKLCNSNSVFSIPALNGFPATPPIITSRDGERLQMVTSLAVSTSQLPDLCWDL